MNRSHESGVSLTNGGSEANGHYITDEQEPSSEVMAEYQTWPHGYVALPTLCACQSALRLLSILPRTLEELVRLLTANHGHLGVALRTLRALGWVHFNGNELAAHSNALAAAENPLLHQLCVDIYADGSDKLSALSPWLVAATSDWEELLPADLLLPPLLRGLLSGAVLTPVLLELRALSKGSSRGTISLHGVAPAAAAAVAAFLATKGMASVELQGETLVLSELGTFVVERSGTFREAVSYRPMLQRLEAVLFGQVREVFTHDEHGHELHVDRTMNVVASGFMHQRYFSDMARVHLRGTFDELPLGEQPSYIVDMGCGDGRLLLTLYTFIRDHTARGRSLLHHPLTMVGVDFNHKSLESTARRLTDHGVPHAVEWGDIGDPATMQATLEKRFESDCNAFLHVRSFLDHDRPFIRPVQPCPKEVESALNCMSDGVYVDGEGGLVTPALGTHASTPSEALTLCSRLRATLPVTPLTH